MGDEVKSGLPLPAHLQRGIATVDPEALADVVVEDPWIESEEQARERRGRQTRLKHARWEERLPADYREASLGDFEDNLARTLLRAYRDETVRNIVLAGPTDAGKTHAAYALGRMAVEEDRWVEAWSVFDLMKQMLPDGDAVLMEKRAKGCSVLIVDDLGATKASEFAVETMTSIVDARVSRRLLTVWTTNATEDELAAVWQVRMMSRMRHGLAAITMPARGNRKPAW